MSLGEPSHGRFRLMHPSDSGLFVGITRIIWLFVLVLVFSSPVFGEASQRLVIAGDSMAFFGDYMPCGFVKMVRKSCSAGNLPFTVSSMTWGGNRSNQLVEKLFKGSSTWKHRGATLLLVFGETETHATVGLPLEETRKQLEKLAAATASSGVRLFLSSAPAWHLDLPEKQRRNLLQFNGFMREFAASHHLGFIDFARLMDEEAAALQRRFPNISGRIFQVKGFFLNARGDLLLAEAILRQCCHADQATLQRTRRVRETLYTYNTSFDLTTKAYKELSRQALTEGLTVSQYIRAKIKKDIE